jgi:hypothetical protein
VDQVTQYRQFGECGCDLRRINYLQTNLGLDWQSWWKLHLFLEVDAAKTDSTTDDAEANEIRIWHKLSRREC